MPLRPLRLAALALVVLSGGVHAQLPERSPFAPVANGTATPAAAQVLEFSGYIDDGDGIRFRVGDPTRKTFAWVRLGEPSAELNLTAIGHDADRELLFVKQQGQPLTLPLRRSKIMNPGATNPSPLRPMIPTPRPATASAAPNPTAGTDLEKIAAAIAKKRAERANAAASPSPATK